MNNTTKKPSYNTVNKYYLILTSTRIAYTNEQKLQATIWLAANWEHVKYYNNTRSTWLFDKAIKNFYVQQNETIKAIILYANETGQNIKPTKIHEIAEMVETGIPVSFAYDLTH